MIRFPAGEVLGGASVWRGEVTQGHRQPPVPYTLAKTTWRSRPTPVPPGPWKAVVGSRVVKTPAMDTAAGGLAWGAGRFSVPFP